MKEQLGCIECANRISDRDLKMALQCTFRYSLGRMTYMPSYVVAMIMNHRRLFNEHDWKQFIKEVDACDRLGMDCDISTWASFSNFCQQMIDEGKEEKKNG